MPRAVIRLRRFPALTCALVLLGTVVGVAGLLSPALLAALERTPAARHDQPWRWVTSLLVQDGGVPGTLSNLLFLLVIGTAVEQVSSRPALLGRYLAAGLAGQVAGQLWQPVGGGNSVAICGLAGALAWAIDRPGAPDWSGTATMLWLGALLATWWLPLVVVGFGLAGLDRVVAARRPEWRRGLLVGLAAVTAAVLVGVANVHGAALAVGLVLGGWPTPARDAGPGAG